MKEPYIPIDCSFHDELESLATLGRRCEIVYRDDNGGEVVAVDVFTRGNEEFVRLGSGAVIRLDALVRVGERRRLSC